MPNLSLRSVRVVATPLAVLGLLAAAIPMAPASAINLFGNRNSNDYQTCAASLTGAGLAEADVAAACAAALQPKDLSECVSQIDQGTEIGDPEALAGCRRVRRPLELATCVVDITKTGTAGVAELDVLEHCRRSLLPLRFSECVVGLSLETNLTTTDAMANCIASSGRPLEVLPNFIPRSGDTPSLGGGIPDNGLSTPTAPMK